MENYKIFKIEHSEYEFVIFSESYETTFSYLDKISKELRKHSMFNKKVIFDMLLNMGNTSERFAEAIFDGEGFIDSTFQYIKIDRKNEVRKIATNFLKNNANILECSILSSVQKKMINKGIVI